LSEPGRYIIADSSVLLCKVTATKKTPEKVFIGTDTGFNHLIRPALYGSHHDIINLTNPAPSRELATICGNIC
jgi:diaminopimelate decarboxylase